MFFFHAITSTVETNNSSILLEPASNPLRIHSFKKRYLVLFIFTDEIIKIRFSSLEQPKTCRNCGMNLDNQYIRFSVMMRAFQSSVILNFEA